MSMKTFYDSTQNQFVLPSLDVDTFEIDNVPFNSSGGGGLAVVSNTDGTLNVTTNNSTGAVTINSNNCVASGQNFNLRNGQLANCSTIQLGSTSLVNLDCTTANKLRLSNSSGAIGYAYDTQFNKVPLSDVLAYNGSALGNSISNLGNVGFSSGSNITGLNNLSCSNATISGSLYVNGHQISQVTVPQLPGSIFMNHDFTADSITTTTSYYIANFGNENIAGSYYVKLKIINFPISIQPVNTTESTTYTGSYSIKFSLSTSTSTYVPASGQPVQGNTITYTIADATDLDHINLANTEFYFCTPAGENVIDNFCLIADVSANPNFEGVVTGGVLVGVIECQYNNFFYD